MKPYYQDEWVTIYHGDCREILPHLPKVDLVLTDPPYGIDLDLSWFDDVHKNRLRAANKSNAKIIGDEGMDLRFLFKYPRWIIFGFPYVANMGATGWLVWDKQPGLMNTDRTLATPVEMAISNIWSGFRLVRCMWAGYMRDNGEYRFEHPTQKPQKVIDYCINTNELYVKTQSMAKYLSAELVKAEVSNKELAKLFPSKTGRLTGCVSNWLLGFNFPTEEEYEKIKQRINLTRAYGDFSNKTIDSEGIILDPFLGSGTTAYCAKKLNRKCIGIEIEEKYCEIAAKRCSQQVFDLSVI